VLSIKHRKLLARVFPGAIDKAGMLRISVRFPSTHSSSDRFERRRLISERRAFSSSVRFLALREIRVGMRAAGRWFNSAIFFRSL
jgi:hypothetical protein